MSIENKNFTKPMLHSVFIIPYLPYELRIVARNVVSETPQRVYGILNTMNIMSLVENDTLYKPILRPISDLKNKSSSELKSEYDINDEIIFWIQELTEKNTEIKYITVECYTFLLEQHFDVFNLISKDLAISIHDIG